MLEEDIDELSKKMLCVECIGEAFLRARVDEEGDTAICSYCGETNQSISIEDLSHWVEEMFEDHFTEARSRFGEDEPDGDSVESIIQWTAEVEPEPAADLQAVLHERTYSHYDAKDGADPQFGPDNYYEEKGVHDWEYQEEWVRFERTLKEQSRFFSKEAESALASIFEGLSNHTTADGASMIAIAGPGTAISALYRARVFQSDTPLEAALARPDKEVGPPPMLAALAGRMNARGISVFYGSTARDVAVAEVRPPVGSRVAVCRFTLIRPLKLLNVTGMGEVKVEGSLFDRSLIRRLEKAKFLESLSKRISMPVMPDDEPFDHLITQAIADYLASLSDPALDGIIYPSAQGAGKSENVVLFHKASRVEELVVPEGTETSVWLTQSNEDGVEPDYTVYETMPPLKNKPPPEPQRARLPFDDFLVHESKEYDRRDPALRVDLSTFEVLHINAVNYDVDAYPVSRPRHVKGTEEF